MCQNLKGFIRLGTCLRLPVYQWQKERHWLDSSHGRIRRSDAPADSASDLAESPDHLYRLEWSKADIAPARPATEGKWLVFDTAALEADALCRQLEKRGEGCIGVNSLDEAARVLETELSLRGVIYFVERSQENGPATGTALAAIRLIQALAKAKTGGSPRLWMVTTGAWHLPGDPPEVSIAQGAVWGLGRVVAREHPELRSTNVDLSLSPESEELQTLSDLLLSGTPEDQIVLRERTCFAARFVRVPREEADKSECTRFKEDATYLLVGGLGGIGTKLAAWMVEQGARHLALMGRKPPSPEVQEEIERLRMAGTEIRVFSADVSDQPQVARVLKAIAIDMPALKGIFHLAAVTDNALLRDVEPAALKRVMEPKASGAWNLHCASCRQVGTRSFRLFSLGSCRYQSAGPSELCRCQRLS